jgi:hypothetical protein
MIYQIPLSVWPEWPFFTTQRARGFHQRVECDLEIHLSDEQGLLFSGDPEDLVLVTLLWPSLHALSVGEVDARNDVGE